MDLPRKPYEYWRRPEIYVVYWLFFAVGFTEEGMAALHDLVSTGNPDFNDPVFWLSYLVCPVNTITHELMEMLPSCVGITFRSPINRKAYQLWRYKIAMSYIKIIVTFGNPDSVDKNHINATTQPFLHAMVSSNKYGRVQYETDTCDNGSKNNYVDGITRAFLITFPENYKNWREGTVWRSNTKDTIPPEQQTVDTSDKPCDIRVDPRTVWKSYQPTGVFLPHANYDIPSNWDPYELMCLMNKGDNRMANYSTATLETIVKENETLNRPDAPPKKRKKQKKTTATTPSFEEKKGGNPTDSVAAMKNRGTQSFNSRNSQSVKDFHPLFSTMAKRHITKAHEHAKTTRQKRHSFSFKSEALDWYRNYNELATELRNMFISAGFSGTKNNGNDDLTKLQQELDRFYNNVGLEIEEETGIPSLPHHNTYHHADAGTFRGNAFDGKFRVMLSQSSLYPN
jgi:hypothetical protein